MIVISPHLDDAVFGCSTMLEGSTVVTVFAGIPPDEIPPSEFDKRAGFDSAAEAMAHRRAEDREAAAILGFKPLHLDLLEAAYAWAPQDVFGELAKVMRNQRWVSGPLGLHHPDHRLAAAAFRSIVQNGDRYDAAWVYEELPYAYAWPEDLDEALIGIPQNTSTIPRGAKKQDAVQAYGSQINEDSHLAAILAPERFHLL